MSSKASFSDLQKRRGRRYAEPDVPGFGVIRLQSLTPSEYVKIEGIKSRAAIALSDGKKNQGEQLLAQCDEQLIRMMWVDDNGAPEVPADVANPFSDVDLAVVAAIVRVCNEHAGVDGKGVVDAEKNSVATLGSDSQ